MPEMIDKNQIIDYLTAIKPDHAVSAYGEGVIDTINHVSRYISNIPSIGVDLVDRSAVTLKLCAACSNMGSFDCMCCVIPKIIKDIPAFTGGDPDARI